MARIPRHPVPPARHHVAVDAALDGLALDGPATGGAWRRQQPVIDVLARQDSRVLLGGVRRVSPRCRGVPHPRSGDEPLSRRSLRYRSRVLYVGYHRHGGWGGQRREAEGGAPFLTGTDTATDC